MCCEVATQAMHQRQQAASHELHMQLAAASTAMHMVTVQPHRNSAENAVVLPPSSSSSPLVRFFTTLQARGCHRQLAVGAMMFKRAQAAGHAAVTEMHKLHASPAPRESPSKQAA